MAGITLKRRTQIVSISGFQIALGTFFFFIHQTVFISRKGDREFCIIKRDVTWAAPDLQTWFPRTSFERVIRAEQPSPIQDQSVAFHATASPLAPTLGSL
jgi:hypothetical protein